MRITKTKIKRKFSTMDILVPITMKNAAKCDKQCELQNSANHQIFERNWRWRDILSACLFQCLETSSTLLWLKAASTKSWAVISHEGRERGRPTRRSSHISCVISLALVPSSIQTLNQKQKKSTLCIWNQARLPAELKHISKQRKRN